MQTFLAYPDFAKSAEILDRQRLGKQRVETLQIMKVLVGESTGWRNHPAVKMWTGYENQLMQYQIAICKEWTRRGYKDTCLVKTAELYDPIFDRNESPWWLGDERLHASHRSNLLRKDIEYYSQFDWSESDDLEYFWPASTP